MEVAAIDDRIEQVTVYASGARVRVSTIPAPLLLLRVEFELV